MDNEILDKIIGKAEHLADIALKAGVAYTGFKATNHWSGGLTALVALRLAQAPNLAAGLAGTGMLAWLGLSAFVSPEGDVKPPTFTPDQVMTRSECLARGGSVRRDLTKALVVCDLPDPNQDRAGRIPRPAPPPVYQPPRGSR